MFEGVAAGDPFSQTSFMPVSFWVSTGSDPPHYGLLGGSGSGGLGGLVCGGGGEGQKRSGQNAVWGQNLSGQRLSSALNQEHKTLDQEYTALNQEYSTGSRVQR